MHQNVLDLGGTAGTLILACYVIGGLVAAASGFLPGNAPSFRLLCVVAGLALSGWAAKVLVLGGTIVVGVGVLLLPVVLTVAAVTGTYRARRPRRTPSLRPHPAAARTYTQPAPYGTPPAAPAPWPSAAAGFGPPTHVGFDAPAHAGFDTPAHGGFNAPVPGGFSAPAHGAPVDDHGVPAVTRAAAWPQTPPARATQPRFHGHAIAPPAAFPTPPRFAPQPLHNIPSPRQAPDGHVTVLAQYPAGHHRTAPAGTDASPRMAFAPMTDPSPLQPSAARHRSA